MYEVYKNLKKLPRIHDFVTIPRWKLEAAVLYSRLHFQMTKRKQNSIL